MGSVILKFLTGGTAGLLVWAVMEPSAPQSVHSASFAIWSGKFIITLGCVVGLAVGGLEGYTRGGKVHTLRGLGLGLVFGAIGATLGSGIGTQVVSACFRGDVFDSESVPMVMRMMARAIAFIPIGMMLGAAIGLSSLTPKRAVQGLIGGALAGAISGVCFDPISGIVGQAILSARGQTQGEIGIVGRAVTCILLGSMIALFLGLVERFARSAWLRLSLGRNEGKEWSIDGAQTFIGRSESAQVPLFGDANVAPIHASITRQGSNYVLTDNGSPIGTFLNGQRVTQAVLFPNAQIQIGGFILQFLIKGHAAPQRGPEMYPGQHYPIGGQMPQVSPYQHPGFAPQGQPMPAQQMPAQQMPMGQMPMQPMPTQAQPAPYGQPTQAFAPAASNPTVAFASPAPQAAGGFALVAMDGPLTGQRFAVGGSMDVGRECPSIPMSFDAGASRRHATLVPSFNGIAVTDLGSTNGTFLNGKRVSQATAGPGDLLKLGSTTFRVDIA
jgi:pSer/pThr/pTyr-binding forkhead associated (FHA) protein